MENQVIQSLSFHPFDWFPTRQRLQIVLVPRDEWTFPPAHSSFCLVPVLLRLLIHEGLPEIEPLFLIWFLDSKFNTKNTFSPRSMNSLCFPRILYPLRGLFGQEPGPGIEGFTVSCQARTTFWFWGRTFVHVTWFVRRFWFLQIPRFFSSLCHKFQALHDNKKNTLNKLLMFLFGPSSKSFMIVMD